MKLRIGTRGSKLALAQSHWVKEQIEAAHPHVQVELVKIKTTGDKVLDSPLSRIGGKGLFVKEIEEALLSERVHLAVHSAKDVPAKLPEALTLPVFPQREDPRDAFLSVKHKTLEELPRGARLGTSSLRRMAQVRHLRPDLRIVPLRGNVDTRLRKMEAGEIDAVVLAVAGLRRLGLAGRISQVLSQDLMLHAVAQGALALECRREDAETLRLIAFLNHDETAFAVRAERAFLRVLEGGCQVPIAASAELKNGLLRLVGLVAETDGSRLIKDEEAGETGKAEEIGAGLARRLLAAGADEILDKIYSRSR